MSQHWKRFAQIAAITGVLAATATPAMAAFPGQGNRVLFGRVKASPARVDPGRRGTGPIDLWTMKANGDDQTRVIRTDTITEYGGRWSPNGSRIVFAGFHGSGHVDVFVARADGTHRDKLTPGAANYTPGFSNDGNLIAWTRISGTFRTGADDLRAPRGAELNLMVMNDDGSAKHSVFTGYAISPGFRPTTSRLSFSTSDGDSFDVWSVKPNGTGLQQVTDYGAGTTTIFGDWAPDGESYTVLFQPAVMRGVGSGWNLLRVDADDPNSTVPLATNVDPLSQPAYTSNGGKVIFESDDGIDRELWSVKSDGSALPVQLTDNGTDDVLSIIPLL
jgi:Tol biopolymer transport system component